MIAVEPLLQRGFCEQCDLREKYDQAVIDTETGEGDHTKNITFFEEFFENCFSFVFNELHKNKLDRLPGHT